MEDFYSLLNTRFYNKESILKYLNITKTVYKGATDKAHPYYLKILSYSGDKFSDEYFRLVYDTLSAWGMNSRGAKLNKLSIIKKSIIDNREKLLLLNDYVIGDIEKNIKLQRILRDLFFDLKLVAIDKTPLVTFSKTMHFFFNKLIAPIDRKYTRSFFGKSIPSNILKQCEYFLDIEKAYSCFSKKADIEQYVDKEYNRNIPKTLDNLVIGYVKAKEMKLKYKKYIDDFNQKYDILNDSDKETLKYCMKMYRLL